MMVRVQAPAAEPFADVPQDDAAGAGEQQDEELP
jgi:hypothetical protein